jgi:uncharacterized protein YukE
MPTSYTYKVASGEITTLRQFALECAKAFIDDRDAAPDQPIPTKLAPDTAHHNEELEHALKALNNVAVSTDWGMAAFASYQDKLRAHDQRREERADVRWRYKVMLKKLQVLQTFAPANLYSFMIQQLELSLSDVDEDADAFDREPVRMTGAEFRLATLEQLAKDMAYHLKERQGIIDRTAERNAWLQQLWASLPPDETEGA